MLLDYAKALLLQRRAERAPRLAFTVTDVPALLEQTRRTLFPAITEPAQLFFIDGAFVACIHHGPRLGATVFIHDLLNRPETPPEVFRYILTHELIHLVVPSREIEGKIEPHPPEFWEAERELSPDRGMAFSWLWWSFSTVLKEDKENECIRVKRSWKRSPELICVLPWDERRFCSPGVRAPVGDEAGPPSWLPSEYADPGGRGVG